jgi:hypothetical protein
MPFSLSSTKQAPCVYQIALSFTSGSNFKLQVCHIVALPFYIFKKSILKQKKNYEIFKYFTVQKNDLPKIPLKEKPKP